MPALIFNIRHQRINRVDCFLPVRYSKNYLYAEFNFLTQDWEGVPKTAVFKSQKYSISVVLGESDTCLVPHEVLEETKFSVSVFGGNLITVDSEEVKVFESGYRSDLVEPPTPDVYTQILTALNGKADDLRYENNILYLMANNNAIASVKIVAGSGGSGTDGREVELRNNGEYIQWRYSGEEEWVNLVALADLKGEKGDDYVLTDEDIEEIASKVKVATSADKITYDDTETQLGADNVQGAISQLSEQKVNNPSTGAVGQILEIETVDENGKPKTYKAVDKPQGGGSAELTDGCIKYNHIDGIEYTEGSGDSGGDEPLPDLPDVPDENTVINLFDKDTMQEVGWLWRGSVNSGGVNAEARHASVPIVGGKTYAFQRTNATYTFNTAMNGIQITGSDLASLCFYDANGTYLYGILNVNNYLTLKGAGFTDYAGDATFKIDNADKGVSFTTEENVAFVKFNVLQAGATIPSDEDSIMLEEGDTCHDYVPYASSVAVASETDAPNVSTQEDLSGYEITGLFGASLSDKLARQHIAKIQNEIGNVTGLSDDALINSGVRKSGYTVEPMFNDIPTVYANGESFADMTADKNEVKMSFKYISKTKVFGGWMKIKWQGNLSLGFSKHNFTVKLYGDKNLDRKLKVDLKGWGLQNKFVWKANYIDRSHARNIVSARLWSDIVASRPTCDERLLYSPNHGAVDGFPFILYVNGEYYGLMTWNIPKDGWMAEMTEDNENHCILCAEINNKEGNSSCDFNANYSESAWSVEFPDEIRTALIYSFNDIINCVQNDSDEDFKINIKNHLEIYSVLDYYSFFYLNGGTDSLAKNMLLLTYGGIQWILDAYDMDGTWGRNWNGTVLPTTTQCPENYENTNSLLWKRIEECFPQELHDRYFELRETILSKEYIMAKFEQFVGQISEEMYAEDHEKNGMYGVSGQTFLSELSTWLDGRFTYVDAEMEAFNTVTE